MAGHESQRRVLLVVRQPGNAQLLVQAAAEVGLVGVPVVSEEQLRAELADASTAPRSALVDVSGFGRTVWALCEALRERDVPFVVLYSPSERALGNRTVGLGATSVLQKPVAKSALLQLIDSLGEWPDTGRQ